MPWPSSTRFETESKRVSRMFPFGRGTRPRSMAEAHPDFRLWNISGGADDPAAIESGPGVLSPSDRQSSRKRGGACPNPARIVSFASVKSSWGMSRQHSAPAPASPAGHAAPGWLACDTSGPLAIGPCCCCSLSPVLAAVARATRHTGMGDAATMEAVTTVTTLPPRMQRLGAIVSERGAIIRYQGLRTISGNRISGKQPIGSKFRNAGSGKSCSRKAAVACMMLMAP